jgi:phosphoribosylformimino-5-aminoimidazole carboxamide ribotide isomerase
MNIRQTPVEAVWQMRQEVMYPAETIDFVKLDNDADGMHWGMYIEEELVSVISVFDEVETVQFRKFATRINHQGKGYGSALLDFVMQQAIQQQKKSIWCNARLSATGLYEKFGMQPVGQTWNKYGIEFIKMEKQFS